MEMPGTGISEFRGNIELVAQRNLRRTSHFIFWLDDDTIAQASTCCPWQAEMVGTRLCLLASTWLLNPFIKGELYAYLLYRWHNPSHANEYLPF